MWKPATCGDADRGAGSRYQEIGMEALAAGGWRWFRWPAASAAVGRSGAGVVKALNPFARFAGRHRNFIEVHLAKSRRTSLVRDAVPHVITTSYLTHDAIAEWLDRDNTAIPARCFCRPGDQSGCGWSPWRAI